MEREKTKKTSGEQKRLQNMQAFLLKLCSQECMVAEAKRRENKGEYRTIANLLQHSWAVVAWIMVHSPSII